MIYGFVSFEKCGICICSIYSYSRNQSDHKFPIDSASTMRNIVKVGIFWFIAFSSSRYASYAQRTAPCSTDGSIVGYSNVSALNLDIEDELAAILDGVAPSNPYQFILCPNTVFDISNDPLLPMISDSTFQCGNGNSGQGCRFEGGFMQILIQEPSNPSYVLSNLTFQGITFSNFSGTSVAAFASSATKALFNDCHWNVSEDLSRILV